MIEIRNSETLQRWLLESGHLGRLWDRPRFLFDRAEFEREVAGVREQYPQFSTDEAEARAALRLLGKEEGRSRALIVGKRRQWTRRERLFLAVVVLLAALVALLLCVPRARAQELPAAAHGDYVLGRSRPWDPQGQPSGIIIQVQNQGSTILTRPAGLLVLNFSTNLSASASANTITVTASGGSGSGCIPPGSTANALLFDAGSGSCSDVSKLTWAGSTLTGASGLTVDFSAASALKLSGANTSGLPGSSGQLLYNNGGNLGAEDPVVSGPDATGAAQTKNPVAGLAGLDYGTGCSGGPCVREAKVDPSGNLFVGGSVAVTGTFWQATQPVSGTFWQATQPVSGTFWQATQPVSIASMPSTPVTGTFWQATQPVSGTFWQTTQPVSIATMPTTPVTGTFWQTTQPVSWSGQSVSLTGSWPYSGALGSVSVSNFPSTYPVTGTFWQTTQPVSGTFWQTTQPVSLASLPALASGSNTIGKVDILGNAGATMDVAIGGATAATDALQAGCVYNSSLPSLSTGYGGAQQCDSSGRHIVVGAGTAGTAAGGVVSVQGVASMTPIQENLTQIGGTTLAAANPCLANTPTAYAVSEATTTTTQLWAGSSGKHNWICSIFLLSATAQNINLLTGTGTNCATVHAGLLGGTTAATGPNLAANGGFTLGGGAAVVAGGNDTTGDEVCYASSGSGQVSGVIMYVQQ